MYVKLRLESELEKGDLVTTADAVADALEAAALHIRAGHKDAHGVLDVPRGKLAYIVEGK